MGGANSRESTINMSIKLPEKAIPERQAKYPNLALIKTQNNYIVYCVIVLMY